MTYPEAQVTVHEDFMEDLVNACVAGEIDLGLLALPVDDERITVERLYSEELLIAMAGAAPLCVQAAGDARGADARAICAAKRDSLSRSADYSFFASGKAACRR